MSHTIALTDNQYTAILSDFYATAEQRKRMGKEDVEKLATMLNTKIDIPFFFSEPKEYAILVKIVTGVDRFLYDNLPNEIYDSIRNLDDGIVNDEEAKNIVSRITKLANRQIDIPYLPELVEHFAISLLVRLLVNGMRKNWTLDKAIENAKSIEAPEFNEDEDEDELF